MEDFKYVDEEFIDPLYDATEENELWTSLAHENKAT